MLAKLGVAFDTRPSGAAELEAGAPSQLALENARRKAAAVRAAGVADPDAPILGCDTVVALDGRTYGKPANEEHARATLQALSGRTHTVISGLALLLGGEERSGLAQTDVRFRTLSQELIDWYLRTGEWRGRAGGYAIQGAGAALVRAVEGDYENVVGLPVALLLDLYPELLPGPRG